MDLQFAASLLLVLLVLASSWFLLPVPWAKVLLWLGRHASGMESREIKVNGIRWHYLESGNGPALVMVHGFGATADHWYRLAPQLRKQFRVVAPDLVGFGTSYPGDELKYDVSSQAERLGSLLDGLGIDRCILAGSSMGGWICTEYAAANPDRVTALWLLAPLGVLDSDKSPLLEAADLEKDSPVQLTCRRDFEHHVVRQMFVRPPWIPYPLRIYFGAEAVRRSNTAERMFKQVRRDSTPLEELAPKVHVPVLLQWGDHDRAVDVSGAEALQKAFPNIETRIQRRVGHLPMLETSRESLRFFMDFYREKLVTGSDGL
jgi:triacylglycerol lipase